MGKVKIAYAGFQLDSTIAYQAEGKHSGVLQILHGLDMIPSGCLIMSGQTASD